MVRPEPIALDAPAKSAALCIQAYLSAAAVDFSDCFERAELIERFRTVQLERSVTDVEQMKAKANAAFKRESYEYAVRLYTEASLAALALFGMDPDRGRSLLVRPCHAHAHPPIPSRSPEWVAPRLCRQGPTPQQPGESLPRAVHAARRHGGRAAVPAARPELRQGIPPAGGRPHSTRAVRHIPHPTP